MNLLGTFVDPVEYTSVCTSIVRWAQGAESRYVCVANAHMLMVARDSTAFRMVLQNSDLVTPDGMPLVWMMRLKGHRSQERVYGPTLMLRLLEAAAREGISVGFYGGEPHVLDSLVERMQMEYPRLHVAYAFSPPYRALTSEEDWSVTEQINESGARILFVGLGCPKQEYWMAAHRGRVNAVMVGVGAAFDFHAGVKPQAPAWVQKIGLEWAFRLFAEPGRLWKRYLLHNPRFAVLAVADLMGVLKD